MLGFPWNRWPCIYTHQPVISENTIFASIFELCFLSFPSGLGSSVRAQSAWEKPAVHRENDGDRKLQKVQRFRKGHKLIWASLVWKLRQSVTKSLNSLVRHLADQRFSWVWSNLRVTFSALFPYFAFLSAASKKCQKNTMVPVRRGRLPTPPSSVHQHIKEPSLQTTKTPANQSILFMPYKNILGSFGSWQRMCAEVRNYFTWAGLLVWGQLDQLAASWCRGDAMVKVI